MKQQYSRQLPIRLVIFYQNTVVERTRRPDQIMRGIIDAMQRQHPDKIQPKLLIFFNLEQRKCINYGDAEEIMAWIEKNGLSTVYCYLTPSKSSINSFLKSPNRGLMSLFGDTTRTFNSQDALNSIVNQQHQFQDQREFEFEHFPSDPGAANFSKKRLHEPEVYFDTIPNEEIDRPKRGIKIKLGAKLVPSHAVTEETVQPAVTPRPPRPQFMKKDKPMITIHPPPPRPPSFEDKKPILNQRPPSMPHTTTSHKHIEKKPLGDRIPAKPPTGKAVASNPQKPPLHDYYNWKLDLNNHISKKKNDPLPSSSSTKALVPRPSDQKKMEPNPYHLQYQLPPHTNYGGCVDHRRETNRYQQPQQPPDKRPRPQSSQARGITYY